MNGREMGPADPDRGPADLGVGDPVMVEALATRERMIEISEQAITDLRTERWELDGTTPTSGEMAEVSIDKVLNWLAARGRDRGGDDCGG